MSRAPTYRLATGYVRSFHVISVQKAEGRRGSQVSLRYQFPPQAGESHTSSDEPKQLITSRRNRYAEASACSTSQIAKVMSPPPWEEEVTHPATRQKLYLGAGSCLLMM